MSPRRFATGAAERTRPRDELTQLQLGHRPHVRRGARVGRQPQQPIRHGA